MTARMGANKPGLLTLTIKDKSALYLAYMPFVRNGGLFIPTNSNYRLGDEVFMLLNLMGEDEKLPVAGRVIWVTPKGAQGKRTAGIGVQFSEQDRGPDAEEDRDLSRRRARRGQGHTHDVAVLLPARRRECQVVLQLVVFLARKAVLAEDLGHVRFGEVVAHATATRKPAADLAKSRGLAHDE